jgi:DNA-binding NarL/FixJ family response regulator
MSEIQTIRVLTVDDHPLMMAGIAGEINAQADMRVIAQASDGDDAIAKFRAHRPDVTLMDIRMRSRQSAPNFHALASLC